MTAMEMPKILNTAQYNQYKIQKMLSTAQYGQYQNAQNTQYRPI